VYKVTDTRIVIAVDAIESGDADLDLPERCRVVKLANSVTYDRMDKAIDHLEKIAIPSARKVISLATDRIKLTGCTSSVR
jgi:DNA polymerase alpha-associated DNA helicase A